MENLDDYRETRRTGTTPQQGDYEPKPEKVDPSVLTDDRGNDELLVFEKTWGHRMLAGVSIAILVSAVVIIVYFLVRLSSIIGIMDIAGSVLAVQFTLWVVGVVVGILTIPPALAGIYVAKHPKHALVAVAFAIVALLFVVAFFVYAVVLAAGTVVAALMWTLLFAFFPVLYLIAAIKVALSNKN